MQKKHNGLKWILAGLVFAVLWSSASTATKVALNVAQPLVIAVTRFGVASLIMLIIAHLVLRKPLPQKREWKPLVIYGMLNITVYLGLYVFAMQQVTASIGALTVAVSPVFISFISVFFLKKPLPLRIILAICICLLGILVVAWPLLGGASVTPWGLVLLLASMLSYSIGTMYFSSRSWGQMHLFVINGWQTFFGGLLMLPVALVTYKAPANHYTWAFWGGTLWLAIPVSIGAVLLWLDLLKQDAVKAGMWLFISPVFGIIIAALWVRDPVSIFTILGVILVLAGLALSQSDRRRAGDKR
ncbi:DMT family transporter [Niabella drilacis]|uniref:Permease of the drug/metabolite transporter (DMT) superfamily n=1 Tax=Niabella drilacis (strain DSM 25811 / CCM 8410 / CCUG 62505 / LMG 26954 / E90) TaxID=1285928 RepID=A0A1G7B5U1_NIADE|nr:DMT family transporter [Niabella drilacis]SDE22332.1 Permease of the drug/metabolite transporter (DMT) superfamily [Niabella drilacis]